MKSSTLFSRFLIAVITSSFVSGCTLVPNISEKEATCNAEISSALLKPAHNLKDLTLWNEKPIFIHDGICTLDPKTMEIHKMKFPNLENVLSICTDERNNLYALQYSFENTQIAVCKINPDGKCVKSISLPTDAPLYCFGGISANDKFLAVACRDKIFRWSIKNDDFVQEPDLPSLIETPTKSELHGDELYLASHCTISCKQFSGQFQKINLQTGTVKDFTIKDTDRYPDFAASKDDAIWFIGNNSISSSVYRIKPDKTENILQSISPDIENLKRYSGICFDKNGVPYLLTDSQGILVLNKNNSYRIERESQFGMERLDQAKLLPDGRILIVGGSMESWMNGKAFSPQIAVYNPVDQTYKKVRAKR